MTRADRPVAAETGAAGWRTHRSEKLGYEFSYPPELELKVYFDGPSAVIRSPATSPSHLENWHAVATLPESQSFLPDSRLARPTDPTYICGRHDLSPALSKDIR